MRKLVEVCMGDQSSDEHVNGKTEGDKPRLIADQHQQAATKLDNDC